MRSDSRPAQIACPLRVAGLAVTATTLVALCAMSARFPASPVLAGDRGESHVMRAVAAAVAAAARDLLVGEQSAAALAAAPAADEGGAAPPADGARPHERIRPRRPPLAARQLDLPPPAC